MEAISFPSGTFKAGARVASFWVCWSLGLPDFAIDALFFEVAIFLLLGDDSTTPLAIDFGSGLTLCCIVVGFCGELGMTICPGLALVAGGP